LSVLDFANLANWSSLIDKSFGNLVNSTFQKSLFQK